MTVPPPATVEGVAGTTGETDTMRTAAPQKESDTKSLIRESHRRQFHGEDYQRVAIEIAARVKASYEGELFSELMSEPDAGCDCGFCATAPWID